MVSFGEFFFITLILKNTIFLNLFCGQYLHTLKELTMFFFFVTHLILYMYFFKKWKDLITL